MMSHEVPLFGKWLVRPSAPPGYLRYTKTAEQSFRYREVFLLTNRVTFGYGKASF